MKPIKTLTDDEFATLVQSAARLADPPPELTRGAISLWSSMQKLPSASSAQKVLTRIAAVLSFDSFAAPRLALGMRASSSETRHLLFSAMGRDIDLRISAADDRFVVAGQILGPDGAGVVELTAQTDDGQGPRGASVTTLDSLGEFRIDNVSHGTYILSLHVGDDEIVLPPIDLGKRGKE